LSINSVIVYADNITRFKIDWNDVFMFLLLFLLKSRSFICSRMLQHCGNGIVVLRFGSGKTCDQTMNTGKTIYIWTNWWQYLAVIQSPRCGFIVILEKSYSG